MGVRVRRMIAASVAVAAVGIVPLTALAAPLPDVGSTPVQPPAVPLPPLPSPPAAPAQPAPLPQLPSPPAAPPAVPLPSSGGSVQSPAETLGQVVGGTVQSVAQGSREAVTVAGTRAAAGGASGARARERSRRARAERVHNKRQRLVRRLRGCLDELSPVRGQLLVLRYGIGRGRARGPARVARKLGITQRQYVILHRRAIHRLVRLAETTGCQRSGIARSLLVNASFDSGMGVRGAGVTTLAASGGASEESSDQEEGAVLGESATGGEGGSERSTPAGLSPPIADEMGDLPLILAIAAMAAGLVMWVVARRRRTAGRRHYESP